MATSLSYLYRWLRGAVVVALLCSAVSALGGAGETTLLVIVLTFVWSFGLTALLLGCACLVAGLALLVAMRVGGRATAVGVVGAFALACALVTGSALNVVSRLGSPYFVQALAVAVALAVFVVAIPVLLVPALPFQDGRRRPRMLFIALVLGAGVALEYADHVLYAGLYRPAHNLLHWTAVLTWVVSAVLLPWGTPRRVGGAVLSILALVLALGVFALMRFDADRPAGVLVARHHLSGRVLAVWRSELMSMPVDPCDAEATRATGAGSRPRVSKDRAAAERTAHIEARQSEAPSFLVITVDALACGFFGHDGRKGARTPNIDALAANGAVFTRAYTAGAITMLSIPAMFRGVSPRRMHWSPLYELPTFEFLTRSQLLERRGSGRRPHFINVASSSIGEERPTLPALFHARGYSVVAVVNDNFTDFRPYFGQGFGFDDFVVADGSNFPADELEQSRLDGVAVDEAVSRLVHRQGPFFFWVHLFPTHDPMYVHPEVPPPTGTDVLAMYQHEVNFTDFLVGRLLEAVASQKSVYVILTADHGEQLLPQKGHGFRMSEEMIRVPLIVAGPGIPQKTVPFVVSLVDVYPTILALSGAECGSCLDDIDGVDLRDAWEGHQDARNRVVVVESWLHGGDAKPRWDLVAAVTTERKLKYNRLKGTYKVTNPVSDPQDDIDLQLTEGRGQLASLLRARDEKNACLRFDP